MSGLAACAFICSYVSLCVWLVGWCNVVIVVFTSFASFSMSFLDTLDRSSMSSFSLLFTFRVIGGNVVLLSFGANSRY